MNSTHFYGVSAFFNGIFGLFLVYTVYLRNRKNPLNQSFLLFGVAVSGWSLIYALWCWTNNTPMAEFYLRRQMMFEAFIPATLFHFISEFTHDFQKIKKWVLLTYLLAAVYSVLMLTPAMILGVRKILFFEYWPAPGWLLPSHVVYFVVTVGASFVLLIRRLFHTSGVEKRKTLWMLAAIGIGLGGGSINWLLWFDILVPPTTNFFVGVMFALIAYSMIRYGLMDMGQVLEFMRTSRASTLGLWASSLNHELRNPLYIAKGRIDSHLEAAAEGRLNSATEIEKSHEVLEVCRKQLERALETMERFSNFLKPQEPSAAAAHETVLLSEVVENILSFAAKELAVRHIKVTEKPAEEMTLRGERGQFEEILFNLVMNACHAMEERGGEIAIRARVHNGKNVIEVSDTGPGIPDELQRYLFEPFFTTKGKQGTGLGLYITKQFVERNGGKISVKSKLGSGVCFRLEFPK